MPIIYEPRGKAREYSPLAVNLYNGCNHGCLYCYAPIIAFKTRKKFQAVAPRANVISTLTKEIKKLGSTNKQVLFCFMTDPYNSEEAVYNITRQVLELFLGKVPVAILTKAGKKCLKDIDIFKSFGRQIQIGATLTFDDVDNSMHYEPNAALPADRLETLKILHAEGIRTWASFEPVISPIQSLLLIEKTLAYVDYYKVGKVNNFEQLDKTIDWTGFLGKAVAILRKAKKPFYIKKDLREAAPTIILNENEVNQDLYNVGGRQDLRLSC